jgi:chromosome segregation ATPase
MFNLWPKKKSVDEILEDANLQPLNFTWTSIPDDSSKKDAVIKNLREQQEFLYKENEDLKKILENIEEDGTYEHNNAIKLRQSIAHLRLEAEKFYKENAELKGELETVELEFNLVLEINNDLSKKLIGLNHLKEENVQLMERINEIDSDMNKEYQAEIFTLKNDIAVLKAKYQNLEHNYQGCTNYRDEYKHQLNAANKEIEALKKDIKDYVFDKSEEIDKLKKELSHMKAVAESAISLCDLSDKTEKQKHPMYPIHWGGLDPDILKQAKEQSIEEIVEHLKGIKTQGFEDYDLRDFVESEIKNEDLL